MRKPALLLLLAFTLPLFAYENIVIRDGNRSFNDGDVSPSHLGGLGREYAYFEKDGEAYVILDAATLARIQKELRPQMKLGEEQARIGQQQAEIGQRQAEIGAKQAEIGMQQVSARGERARHLQERQRVLQEKQRVLQEEQRPLAEQQRVLAEKQREALRVAKQHLAKIFDEALRSGIAKQR